MTILEIQQCGTSQIHVQIIHLTTVAANKKFLVGRIASVNQHASPGLEYEPTRPTEQCTPLVDWTQAGSGTDGRE